MMPYGKICSQKQDGASVVANWIWQIVDIYQCGLLGFVLSGFDPVPRLDSAVLVVFLLSSVMNEQLYMLEVFLFVCILQSITQGMKVNKK